MPCCARRKSVDTEYFTRHPAVFLRRHRFGSADIHHFGADFRDARRCDGLLDIVVLLQRCVHVAHAGIHVHRLAAHDLVDALGHTAAAWPVEGEDPHNGRRQLAIAFSFVAIGLAAPARAEDLTGTYTLFSDQSQRRTNGMPNPYQNSSATWTFTPCGPGCARVDSATGWSADARLNNGRWELTREAFWSCPDGRQLANAISYSFDAVTLTGTSSGNVPVGREGLPVIIDGITVTLTGIQRPIASNR